MKKYISCISFISALTAVSSNCFAVSLSETLKIAREYNFEIKVADDKVKQSESDTRMAFSKFLPQVLSKLNASQNKFSSIAYDTGGIGDRNTTASIMQVKQSLLNGGKDVYVLQSSKHLVSAGKAQYKSVLNDVIMRTIQAYEDLRTKREVLKLNENNIKVHEELLSLNQTRFDLGEITSTDISQTKAELAEAVANKETALSDLIAAENTFKIMVGLDAPKDLDPIKLNQAMLPKDLSELLTLAKSKNPSLLSAKYQKEASVKNLNAAYSDMLPKLDASVTMSYLQTKSKSLSSSGTTYALDASMPIFEGGASYATIKKNKEKRDEAKHTASRVEAELQAKAITAWNNYIIYTSIIDSRKQAIDSAEKSLEGVQEELKMGTRTTMDVLEAQQRLLSAQVAHRRALQYQVIAFYNIFNVIGTLDSIQYA